ncbi:MAG: hypothetical protein ACRYFX_14605 [Janthinobacterium lividum]
MTRKELVDKALLKLAHDEAEGAFFALKLFSDASQAEADDSYADDEIELFSILVKQLANMNDAEEHLLRFVLKNTFIRHHQGKTALDSSVVKVWVQNANYPADKYLIGGALYKLLFKQMALMWLKALKFDALIGRFTEWQEEHKVQSQQALVLEQMLSSIKGLQNPNE